MGLDSPGAPISLPCNPEHAVYPLYSCSFPIYKRSLSSPCGPVTRMRLWYVKWSINVNSISLLPSVETGAVALKHLDWENIKEGLFTSMSFTATTPQTWDHYSSWAHMVIKAEYSLLPTTRAAPQWTQSHSLGQLPALHASCATSKPSWRPKLQFQSWQPCPHPCIQHSIITVKKNLAPLILLLSAPLPPTPPHSSLE